jgi:protein phosphatase
MGSRALFVLCRDEDAARERFGATTGETGMIHSRSGRAFFGAPTTLEAVLGRLREAMTAACFWKRHNTGWALIDAGIMPWPAKAQSLIRSQYAAPAATAKAGLSASVALLEGRLRGTEASRRFSPVTRNAPRAPAEMPRPTAAIAGRPPRSRITA